MADAEACKVGHEGNCVLEGEVLLELQTVGGAWRRLGKPSSGVPGAIAFARLAVSRKLRQRRCSGGTSGRRGDALAGLALRGLALSARARGALRARALRAG